MTHDVQSLTLILISVAAIATDAEPSVVGVAQTVKPATVHLTILDQAGREVGTGTGFFVFEDGWIVTNHHVIDGAQGATAVLADDRKLRVEGVLARSVADDLAIVKVEGTDFPTLPLGESETLSQGEKVVVVGGPLGLAGSLSVGIVSAIRADGVEEGVRGNISGPRIQITAAIAPGSSGSPVVNEQGQVIGVAVSGFAGTQSLNFAVPVDRLSALIRSIAPGTDPEPFSNAFTRNLTISAAVLVGAAVLIWLIGRRPAPRRKTKKRRPRA
ncbi:MAG: S1C family serine protease [Myxococcota bacterium]